MKTCDYIEIRKKLKKELDSKRYEHTLGVEFTASALAMRYGEDIDKARLAGLLHDCAKCLTNKKRLSICEKNNIEISLVELNNPFLLHSKVGKYLAQKKYGIDDPGVLSAIEFHTTGKPNMSLLEKIVFIADYIEPGRKQAANLNEIRQLAFVDIDKCLIKILGDTLTYLKASGNELDPNTEETYNFYCNQNK